MFFMVITEERDPTFKDYSGVAYVLWSSGVGESDLHTLKGETHLCCDLGIDSLGYQSVFSSIEKIRGVDITRREDDFQGIRTVNDLAEFLSSLS